jgi:CheY-like chemotaxis protein
MDINMPVMDGFDTTINIRKNRLLIQPIICALTAFSDLETKTKW